MNRKILTQLGIPELHPLGIVGNPEPLHLPPDHPCFGCAFGNTQGAVLFCPFQECKREEYEHWGMPPGDAP